MNRRHALVAGSRSSRASSHGVYLSLDNHPLNPFAGKLLCESSLCLTRQCCLQAGHLGVPEATWQMEWKMTFALTGFGRPFALCFRNFQPLSGYFLDLPESNHICDLNASAYFNRVPVATFQYLLDKRESRQAISTFFDTASCLVISFYVEELAALEQVTGGVFLRAIDAPLLKNRPDLTCWSCREYATGAASSGEGKIKCCNELAHETACQAGCVVYLKQKPHRLSLHDPAAEIIMIQLRDGVFSSFLNPVRT